MKDSMSIFLPSLKDLDSQDTIDPIDGYHEMLVRFTNFHFKNLAEIELIQSLTPVMSRFNCYLNARKILGFRRLQNSRMMPLLNPGKSQKPIPHGIFKGTYGSHGIGIIAVDFPEDNVMQGKFLDFL